MSDSCRPAQITPRLLRRVDSGGHLGFASRCCSEHVGPRPTSLARVVEHCVRRMGGSGPRTRVRSGPLPSQLQSIPSQFWPMPGQSCAIVDSSLGRFRANFGRIRANFGRFRTNFGPFQANFGRFRDNFGRCQGNLGGFRPNVPSSCPDAALQGSEVGAGRCHRRQCCSGTGARAAAGWAKPGLPGSGPQ